MAASGAQTMTAPRLIATSVLIIEVLPYRWLTVAVANIRSLARGHELPMNEPSAHVHAAIHMQLLPGDETPER
jgi:hypothetical protein